MAFPSRPAFVPGLALRAPRAPAPLLASPRHVCGALPRSSRPSTATTTTTRRARVAMTASVESSEAPGMGEAAAAAAAFSAKGMSVDDFLERSIGEWRSQRSSHNLAWTQFEQITSEIVIERLAVDGSDAEVAALCAANGVAAADVAFAMRMSWEGESDWDTDETSEGSSTMAVVKDADAKGRLLRSVGYAETIPAVGEWEMTPDGVFVLTTPYEAAAAEERIWFATPDLRVRVSQIRTSSGRGVLTASFSTEIRRLNLDLDSVAEE